MFLPHFLSETTCILHLDCRAVAHLSYRRLRENSADGTPSSVLIGTWLL